MVNKHNLSAAEPQYLCDICNMAVTNPLCPSCLALEIEAWVTLYPDLKRALLPKLRKFIENAEDTNGRESTPCIKCGETSASICPYCFTNRVLLELKRLDVNKIVLREFFEFFNFDMDHTGYSEEAEELGVI
jgi:hypothetical protein